RWVGGGGGEGGEGEGGRHADRVCRRCDCRWPADGRCRDRSAAVAAAAGRGVNWPYQAGMRRDGGLEHQPVPTAELIKGATTQPAVRVGAAERRAVSSEISQ